MRRKSGLSDGQYASTGEAEARLDSRDDAKKRTVSRENCFFGMALASAAVERGVSPDRWANGVGVLATRDEDAGWSVVGGWDGMGRSLLRTVRAPSSTGGRRAMAKAVEGFGNREGCRDVNGEDPEGGGWTGADADADADADARTSGDGANAPGQWSTVKQTGKKYHGRGRVICAGGYGGIGELRSVPEVQAEQPQLAPWRFLRRGRAGSIRASSVPA